jgi:hypothetical protein
MRNPSGYAIITSPEPTRVNFDRFRCVDISAGTFESDTVQCGHCGRHMHIKPRMDPADMGGLCKQCMKFECPACVGKGCSPLERRIEQMEKRDLVRRSYGL